MRALVWVGVVGVVACTDGAPDRWPDSTPFTSAPAREVPPAEFAARRSAAIGMVPDGILLLNARPAPKSMEEWGFVQDPSFYYFTGLGELPGAILALDGAGRTAHLFVPPPPLSFGLEVEELGLVTGPATARRLGVDEVLAWEDFAGWVESRIGQGVRTLYVDGSRRPEPRGTPPGMLPIAGVRTLWQTAIEARFPRAEVRSAREIIQELRWSKSAAEIAVLRGNALATAHALRSVAVALRPGMRQREAEGVVATACIEAGGQGPSFWPWTMAGPNARMTSLVQAFFRYQHMDRVIEDGDLVRVDIGCAGGHYGADVGRTLPASGRFTPGQRESWDLLISAYEAGLSVMRAGVPVDTVRAASRRAVEAAQPMLETEQGREAARAILSGGPGVWHLHGVGIDSGEETRPVLEDGSVIAYEPGFEVSGDAFYLEDMILITDLGHEVLSARLPYRASEIEALMAR